MITSGVSSASSFPGCNIRRELLEQKLHDFDKAFKRGEVPPEAEDLYCHGWHGSYGYGCDPEGSNKYFERGLRHCPGDTLGEIVSNVDKKEIPWQLAENRWGHRQLPAVLGTLFGGLGTLAGLTSFIEAPGLTSGIVAATSVAMLAGGIACWTMPIFIDHQRSTAENAAAMVKLWGGLREPWRRPAYTWDSESPSGATP